MTHISQELNNQIAKIKLVIFDVDGVLTDGSLYFSHEGQEGKVFHSRDGHGMKMLLNSGVEIGIITARSSPAVAHRMANLGIEHVFQGQLNKFPAYESMLKKLGLTGEQVAYVGDDIVDLPVMTQVGLAIAVADAHPSVKERAHWHTTQSGGRGAARDVCDMIMQKQGTYEKLLAEYTNCK